MRAVVGDVFDFLFKKLLATIMRKYYQETSTEAGRLAKSQGLTSHVVALEIEVKEVYLNFGVRTG